MTKAAKPRSVHSVGIHHLSVRRVRCGISARLGEKTPVALRSAVGALTFPSRCGYVPLRIAAALARDSSVVLVAPEGGVVGGVGDGDLLCALVGTGHAPGELQLLGVDVEPVDVVEDAFGVVDNATGGGAVPVLRRQRCHAPPQASD